MKKKREKSKGDVTKDEAKDKRAKIVETLKKVVKEVARLHMGDKRCLKPRL